MAVLNPSFVGNHSYSTVKGQDYAGFHSAVVSRMVAADPIVLYGIELVFSRDKIKLSKGEEWEKAANRFAAGVRQDAAKLAAAVATTGFLHRAILLAFVEGTSGKVMQTIRRQLESVSLVRLITSN